MSKIPLPTAFRKPVDVDQVVREINDLKDMVTDISEQLGAVPQVKLVPTQQGNLAVFRLEISDLDTQVTAVEFKAKSGPGDFPAAWSNAWTTITGTIGGDVSLIRSVSVPMQEGHNTSIISRVVYPDQFGASVEINHFFTYDQDTVAEILGYNVAISGATAEVNIAGDEDTATIWKKNLGAADSTAVQIINARKGTWVTALTDVIQEFEIAGRSSSGVLGPFVPLTLHRIGGTKTITINAADFQPEANTTVYTKTQFLGVLVPLSKHAAPNDGFVSTVILPPGITITKFEAKFSRDDSGDVANMRLADGDGTTISTLTHVTTGLVTLSASISELVSSANPYILWLELRHDTSSPSGAPFAVFARLTYTAPSFLNTI